MKEYLEKRAVEHAVLHHSGDAAIVAVREIEPAQVIPVEYIREYIKNANIAVERALQRVDQYQATVFTIKSSAARELLSSYLLADPTVEKQRKDDCYDDVIEKDKTVTMQKVREVMTSVSDRVMGLDKHKLFTNDTVEYLLRRILEELG